MDALRYMLHGSEQPEPLPHPGVLMRATTQDFDVRSDTTEVEPLDISEAVVNARVQYPTNEFPVNPIHPAEIVRRLPLSDDQLQALLEKIVVQPPTSEGPCPSAQSLSGSSSPTDPGT